VDGLRAGSGRTVTPIAVAIVGAGPMGRLHARTVAASARRDGDCTLAAIVDRHAPRADRLAREHDVVAVDDTARLPAVGAAIVAVQTASHLEVAGRLLAAGLDVLVEKPLAASAAEGARLVRQAERAGRILQVGHVEWYNPAWRAALAEAGEPRRIEVHRMQPRSERGLDIDVVQDLMLHDLDWVIRAVGRDVVAIEAHGEGERPGDLDRAWAELRFHGGCVATLAASRVAPVRERRLAIAGSRSSAQADLDRVAGGGPGSAALDPLGLQWRAFVEAVRSRKPPENDGRTGIAALEWVERVRAAIRDAGA